MNRTYTKDFDTVALNDIGNCSRKQCDNNNRYYEDDRTNKYVDQCAVCFKGIKSYDNAYTTIGDGHPLILTKRSQHHIVEKSGGYMGRYYLGPECGRQAKKLLKEKGLDWKDWLGHRTNNKELSKILTTEFQADNKIQVSAGKSTNNNPESKTRGEQR